MPSFLAFIHGVALDSETFRLVGQAIDAAEAEFPYGLSPEILARVADGIIDAVRDGERDVFRLRDAGLKGANVVLPSSRRNPLRRLSLFYSSCRQNPLPRLSVSYCQKQQLLSMAYDDHRPQATEALVGHLLVRCRAAELGHRVTYEVFASHNHIVGSGEVPVQVENAERSAARKPHQAGQTR